MENHALANIFPLMSEDEYQKLKYDIQIHGFDKSLPIVLYEEKILDGRNRYKACMELGVEPIYINFEGQDPIEYVVRVNLHRRHLNASQLAFVALETEKYYGEIAKQQQGKRNDLIENEDNILAILPKSEKFQPIHAVEKASKQIGVSEVYIKDAKKIEKEKPELAKKIKAGKMTIPEAKREIRKEEKKNNILKISKQNSELPLERKYNVIYADPPWEYEFSKSNSRAIENHYPTMTLEKICNLKVNELAERDCILFLWVTAPKLEEGLQVVKSWQFVYKTCAIWDKEIIGMGYYFRNQHEILLVATKGNMTIPEAEVRTSSVIRSKRQSHSKKPDIVYEIIDNMFPDFRKIELFARNNRANWDAWGNET